ncbi:MAG: D-amino-acid transaminase [Opitutales bacterium]
MMKIILQNDLIIPRGDAVADIDDRGYQFGDGIYEVIRYYGGRPFMMEEHLTRLWRSARELGIEIEFTQEELEARLGDLAKKSAAGTGALYIQVTRGVYSRIQEFPPSDLPVQLTAYFRELVRPDEKIATGVAVALVPDIRWLRCDIKSLNLIPNVLGRQKAKERGCYEAIQHRDSVVTEGAFSNVFRISGKTVFTHPANNFVLSGVTRGRVLEVCAAGGVVVEEEAFTVEELLSADEVFITSTTNEVMPVVKVDDKVIGGGKPGAMTKRIQSLYEQSIFNWVE